MADNFLATSLLPLFLAIWYSAAFALPQNGQVGYNKGPAAHVPILYEAYYPEPRVWNSQSNLQEVERLRELTSQLLREEEQLGQLAAAVAENNAMEQPRDQVLRYVFSGNPAPQRQVVEPAAVAAPQVDDGVQVASLTISEVGRPHKTRHHHGQANWLVRRLAA